MSPEEYANKRKEMLEQVHAAEDENNAEKMNSIMDEIEKMDRLFHQSAIERANAKALDHEPKPVNLQNYSSPISGKINEHLSTGYNPVINESEVFNMNNNRNSLDKFNFYNALLTNTAGTSTTMSVEIPSTVYGDIVREAPGAFLRGARILNIGNTGKITIPIWAHDTVSTHEENADLTVNGDAPTGVDITHQEYAYLTSYSEQSMATSAEGLEAAIHANLLESHNKAMDMLLLSKVAGLEYTPDTNEVQLSSKATPSYADFVKLAGMLGDDFTDKAQWYMAPATYYKWLCGLTDTAKRPILDPSMAVENQAFLGRHINLDSNVPANVVYFGDSTGLYLNHAQYPNVKRDDNFRKNSVDFKVCSVSGAAIVPGSFVKLDNLGA